MMQLMSGSDVVAAIAAQRVIPVVRTADPDEAIALAGDCAAGGMRVIELTETIPGVESVIEALRRDDLLVGVGTVVAAERVAVLAASGARFIVSFANPPGLLPAASACGIPAIPAAFTPTEVLAAAAAGAAMVKLFPAGSLSPAFVRALRSVGVSIGIMPTGGISASAQAIMPWLSAGAQAVGVGGDLLSTRDGAATPLRLRVRTLLDDLGHEAHSSL
jgi:2-dehydro-3-deoxyphosphogluconate aldolase / (4S)-4-hydroxy-2-oxoglutarate aldolase